MYSISTSNRTGSVWALRYELVLFFSRTSLRARTHTHTQACMRRFRSLETYALGLDGLLTVSVSVLKPNVWVPPRRQKFRLDFDLNAN